MKSTTFTSESVNQRDPCPNEKIEIICFKDMRKKVAAILKRFGFSFENFKYRYFHLCFRFGFKIKEPK